VEAEAGRVGEPLGFEEIPQEGTLVAWDKDNKSKDSLH